ncbi:anhydro-N-acetylmuramic acid kinase [Micromonospora sp. DR5-3]|uniref:anhydro-N-acetylmuramic acid kinase n=1 Tax=unclassified Micromonospora TaxID=2617518 RepID=UPI002101EF22|nr:MULTISPECIES: anhydro-N-acetylmuramic acid kinase [unclassified Micromonospora]MCW3814013.1 anhydro-N-acetylmuramic acid kinase [Micromonospora sp. DR5-3]
MISGTSHDGIDVAAVDFTLRDGVLHGTVAYADSAPYPEELRVRLMRALPPAALTFAEACELDTLIGQAFAEVAAGAAGRAGGVDLICSHGQTVFHWVQGREVRGTLQIGQPAWIAERTGVPVVADVRVRDVVAGGQGAPLVSLMDVLLLSGLPGRPAALNLGGIANLTVLRPSGGGPVAYDTGPANALIDAAVVRASGGRLRYDEDGRLAAAGRVHDGLLAELLAEPYYRLDPPKTTGKELFHAAYLESALAGRPGLSDADVAATLTALTAQTVADQVRRHRADTLVASGGGCANPALMDMLREQLPGVRVTTADEFGAPADTKEAIAFALIGWHTAHGLPATVPSCTGATGARVLGAIVPGAGPLRLPAPVAAAPTALRLTGAG